MMGKADTGCSAIDVLRSELEKAELRLSASVDGSGQRAAVIQAVRVVTVFAHTSGCRIGPLVFIEDALRQLDHGAIAPMLVKKGNPKGGRARAGMLRGILQGHAVGIVRAMVEVYDEPLPEARRKVACVLQRAGIRPLRGRGEITARTIKEWTDAAAADKASAAAASLRRVQTGQRLGDPKAMKEKLLDGLAALAAGYAGKVS